VELDGRKVIEDGRIVDAGMKVSREAR